MAKRIVKLKHRLVDLLDLPAEASEGAVRIQLVGAEHMLVENHCGIYEYRPEWIRLSSRSGILRIEGEALALRELSRERLYIGGSIRGFAYEAAPEKTRQR